MRRYVWLIIHFMNAVVPLVGIMARTTTNHKRIAAAFISPRSTAQKRKCISRTSCCYNKSFVVAKGINGDDAIMPCIHSRTNTGISRTSSSSSISTSVTAMSTSAVRRGSACFGTGQNAPGDVENSKEDQQDCHVCVHVYRFFPHIPSPKEAKSAWLSFVWNQGGGLPFLWVVRPPSITRDSCDVEDLDENLNFSPSQQHHRLLLPFFMQEELLPTSQSVNNETNQSTLQYKVIDAGLFTSEIIASSHLGTVQFSSKKNQEVSGISMIWSVEFQVTNANHRDFWQLFTNKMMLDASNNFYSRVDRPILYTRKTKLMSKFDSPTLTTKLAMEKWIEFCWKQGGGMPFPPPINFIQDDGNIRLIIPPFLKERIISSINVSESGEQKSGPYSEIIYIVDNPSLATYQVHTHLGRIRFIESSVKENTIDMIWEIEIRPYYRWSMFVKLFTSTVVTAYAKNFKCHLANGPDALVAIKPPRGKFGGKTLMKIRKDSWLGGILSAHLNDDRSPIEQVLSSLQPWTWGHKDETNEGESWSEGSMP